MVNFVYPPIYIEIGLLKKADLHETINLINGLNYDISLIIINEQRNAIIGSTTRDVMEGKLEAKLIFARGEWLPGDKYPKVPYELKDHVDYIKLISSEDAARIK